MQALSIVLLSGEQALQRSLDVVANNVANANTTGFKREGIAFSTVYEQSSPGKAPLQLAFDRATYRDTSNGPLNQTGNPLDLAISGKGYFEIQRKDGSIGYTRDGSFQMNSEGQIVTHSGQPVLGDSGQPITLPETTSQINIGADGFLTARTDTGKDLAQIGKVGIVTFDNEQLMQPAGNNTFTTTQASHVANGSDDSSIVQGSIEQSNAKPVEDMTTMIQIMRNYQQVINMMSNEHDRSQNALGTLAKTTV